MVKDIAFGAIDRPVNMPDDEWDEFLAGSIKALQKERKPLQDQKREAIKHSKELKRLESLTKLDEGQRQEALQKELRKVELSGQIANARTELTSLSKDLISALAQLAKSPEDPSLKLAALEAQLRVKQTEATLKTAQGELDAAFGKASSSQPDEWLRSLHAEIAQISEEIAELHGKVQEEREAKTAAAEEKKKELLARKQAAEAALAAQKKA